MNELFGDDNNDQLQEIFSLIEINDKIFKYHLDRFKYASRFNYEESATLDCIGIPLDECTETENCNLDCCEYEE